MQQRTFLFGYDHLMYPEGANECGMHQWYRQRDFHPCKLVGFKRGAYLEWALRRYYSAIPSAEDYILGTVFEIHTEHDLYALLKLKMVINCDPRGIGPAYMFTDVTNLVQFDVPPSAKVMALIHPEYKHPEDGQLDKDYQQRVWNGIQIHGQKFVKEFLLTGGRQSIKG